MQFVGRYYKDLIKFHIGNVNDTDKLPRASSSDRNSCSLSPDAVLARPGQQLGNLLLSDTVPMNVRFTDLTVYIISNRWHSIPPKNAFERTPTLLS